MAFSGKKAFYFGIFLTFPSIIYMPFRRTQNAFRLGGAVMCDQLMFAVYLSDIESATHMHTLSALASFADSESGECYPSIEMICKRSRYSRRAVVMALAHLERKEWITRAKRRKQKGLQTTNLYQLNMPRLRTILIANNRLKKAEKVEDADANDRVHEVHSDGFDRVHEVHSDGFDRVHEVHSDGFDRVHEVHSDGQQGASGALNGVHEVHPNKSLKENKSKDKEIRDLKKTKQKKVQALCPPDPVLEIFGHWKFILGKSDAARLTPKRRKNVQARLKDGYTLEHLKQAIEGCAKSAFHMGHNDRGVRYDDLALICRDGEHVEQFIEMLTPPPKLQVLRGGKPQGSSLYEQNLINLGLA